MKKREFQLYSQLPVFRQRVERARARVAKWLLVTKSPYVSYSGGKDSTCILALVREQLPQCPAVYFDADSAFPEVETLLDQTQHLIKQKTSEPILSIISRLGLSHPQLERETMRLTVHEPVKSLIAEFGFDGVCYGLRAEESRGRALHAYTRGALFQYRQNDVWACQPIWDWTYFDVWSFIVSENLSYCAAYDRMWDAPIEDQRLSYWAGETKRRWGRYAWLKRNYPDLWTQLKQAIPDVTNYA